MPRSTKFRTQQLSLTGASAESRTRSVSAQRTVNFYPEINPGGKGNAILQPWLGRKTFGTPLVSGIDRGAHFFKGALYHVAGTNLYKVSSTGAHELIGVIEGNDYTSIEDNGFVMLVVASGKVYQWDEVALTELTFPIPTTKITYLNNQFILDGNDGRFAVLDVGQTTLTGTNYGTPESAPDPHVTSYIFNQLLFLYGTETIEPWENTGQGEPPFERMNGGIIEEVGICGKNAVTHTKDAMYFIAANGDAYMAAYSQVEQISRPAQSHAFQTYGDISDCIAQYVSFEGSKFVVFNFPTANKTWVYSETIKDWFELDHGTQRERYRGQTFIRAYNKNLCADYETGELFELSLDTIDTDIVRERTIQGINGELFGKPGQRMQMSRFWFTLQANGNVSGNPPQIMVQPSYDGGRTFGKEYFLNTGLLGNNVYQVKWDNMATFYDMVLRVRISDPVFCSIIASSIDIREAGY